MDDRTTNLAMVYTPTWAERLWRTLGYRSNVPDTPSECEAFLGWIRTDVRVRLSIPDRLRALVSGHLLIRCETLTEHEPGDARTASSFEVVRPGSPDA